MRYINIDTVIFTNEEGKSFSVKDVRLIEEQVSLIIIKNEKNVYLDEVANRKNIYGENSESDIYKIFDFNIVKIVESRFDINKLKELRIPV